MKYACIPGEKTAEEESGCPGKGEVCRTRWKKKGVVDTRQIPLGNDGGCPGGIEKDCPLPTPSLGCP